MRGWFKSFGSNNIMTPTAFWFCLELVFMTPLN